MVISSLIVETIEGCQQQVANDLAQIEGVIVHHIEGTKIVITLESETARTSHDVAAGFISIPNVLNVDLIYVNFEDDPEIQALWEKRQSKEAHRDEKR